MTSGFPQEGGPALETLPSARTAERIAHRLAAAIATGQYRRGDRLPSERDLAARLEVSRDSVRAALRRLVADGLLQIRRGRGGGAFVSAEWADASAVSVRHTLVERRTAVEVLLDYRCLVEELVARTAAGRADLGDRRSLRELLREAARAPSTGAGRADAALHLAVAEATHNARLVALHRRLLSEVVLGGAVQPCAARLGHRSPPDHQALVAAVCAGEAEEAARVAGRHFAVDGETVRAVLHRVEAAGSTPGGP
ncbi:FadR/GntR family transcriptional regulator [Streptomyces sp. NPDC059740]|uniref:FadR/GntR family transcriptional regulator n=1 Tax=Streptomyces sp. NPDC059740 TaxID=3346926 RepID=UPI00366987D4